MEARDYRDGQRWLVVKEGAYLEGMKPLDAYAYQGWSMALRVGDVLVCRGGGMTFGDGVYAIKWTPPRGDANIVDCIFRPSKGGTWGGMPPADGYLEPIIE